MRNRFLRMRLLIDTIPIFKLTLPTQKNYTISLKKMFKTIHNLTSAFGRTPQPTSLYAPALHGVPEIGSSVSGTSDSAANQCTSYGSSSLKPA